MAEEVKPIKTERIDNSDGTYTINEWYKTGKEIAISYLSNTFLNEEIHSTVIYNKPLQGWKCIKRIMTPETKILKVDYYSDIKCQKILQQEEYIYNQDAYIVKLKEYTDSTSMITTYNYKDKIICREHYDDMEWKNLSFTEKPIYCENGKFENWVVYPSIEGEGFLSCIGYYDSEEDLINKGFPKIKKCYKDKDFQNLLMTSYYTVNKDLSYIEKVIYANGPHNNHLSFIQYFDKYNNIKCAYYYFDNNFYNLDFSAKTKYQKKTYINFIEYKQANNGFYTLLLKYDYDKNLIYKKQYKFKGILAHILFWLAR